MIVARMQRGSLRLEWADSSRLFRAFVISLVLHTLVVGGYQAGKKYGWWENWQWPAWLESANLLAKILKKDAPAQPLQSPQEPPLVFVDVSPAQASTEPPKDSKFYSDKNSRAANPDAEQETTIPKIAGNQEQVPKTQDVPRPEFTPLQPALPAEPAPKPQEEVKAKPAEAPGDLALAKPDPQPKKDQGEAPRPRPRTLAEARARQADQLPGQKMKQEGGVKRRLELAALDAKATPFGAYDAALVAAISERWFALIEERGYASYTHGKVVLQFVLHYDGRISAMNVAENTSGEVLGLLCQKAVLDPSPYSPWPGDMRRMLGETRKIQFTFYYN